MVEKIIQQTPQYKRKRALKRFNQDFDKNETLTKAGKTFCVYDKIQEAREDTEIIPTLKKYGCIPVTTTDSASMYQDFTQAQDLRGVLDRKIAAENAFYNLPIEIRREFDHNIDRFIKEGEKYIKNRIEKEQAESAKQQTTETQPIENSKVEA